MINHNIKLLALGLLLLFAYSCKKDILGEGQVTTETPVPNVWVESTVIGLVQDEAGQPLSNVLVDHIGNTFMTDDNGYFTLPARGTTVNGGYITFTKDGYYENSKFFIQQDQDNYSFLRVTMLDLGTPEVIDPSTANTVSIDNDLAQIEFKANSFVDESGNAYNGAVSVYSQYIDPTSTDLAERMPGDLRAIDINAARVQLSTFGMLATELRGENGQKLQIADGSSATIKMVIPEALRGSITPTIPVWSFDESNGYWVEESEASQTADGYYTAEVSHFSYWNYDAPWPIVGFCGRFTYSDGTPVAHARVTVVIVSSGVCKSAWTDSRGKVSGDVPKDQPLEIIVTDECGNIIYQEEIGSYSEDFTLNITVPVSLDPITVQGTLTCNGQPVSNGYVHITDDRLVRQVAPTDENGNYSLALSDCNATSRVTVQGYDLDEPAIGEIEIVDVISDVVVINQDVCTGESEEEFITIEVEELNSQQLFNTPLAKLINGTDLIISSNTIPVDSISGEYLSIRISNATLGPNNTVTRIEALAGQAFLNCSVGNCADNFSVNLSSTGNQVGDIIEGTYEGTLANPNGNPIIVTGRFRVMLDEVCNTANISGRLYLDDNNNGQYDIGEDLTQGSVRLLNDDGSLAAGTGTSGEFAFNDVVNNKNYSILVQQNGFEIAGTTPIDLNCQGINIDPNTRTTSSFLLGNTDIVCIDIPFKRVELDCASAVSLLSPANSCSGSEGQLQIGNPSPDVIIFTVNNIDGTPFSEADSLIIEGNSIGEYGIVAGSIDYTIMDENGTELCSGNILMTSDAQVEVCEIFPEIFCDGDDLVFEVFEYWCPNLDFTSVTWSNGSTTGFSTTVEGSYSGFFTDDMGCQGQVDFVVDFSEFKTVGGIVWQDSPSGIDGVFQAGETLLTNIEVSLFEESDPTTPIDIVMTDNEGRYVFENLDMVTTYLISIELPAGFEFSPQEVGTNNRVNSKVDPITGFATYLFECSPDGFPDGFENINIGIKEL